MRYMDRDGDVWEDMEGESDQWVRCVQSCVPRFAGIEKTRDDAEAEFGPLVPEDESQFEALPTVDDVMDRASVFQSAHALVKGLTWHKDEHASIYDVLQVAKWLESEG